MGSSDSRQHFVSDLPKICGRVRIGDILEFPRKRYQIFGVYAGKCSSHDHGVIHFNVPYSELESSILFYVVESLKAKEDVDKTFSIAQRKTNEFRRKNPRKNIGEVVMSSVRELLEDGTCEVFINNKKFDEWKNDEDKITISICVGDDLLLQTRPVITAVAGECPSTANIHQRISEIPGQFSDEDIEKAIAKAMKYLHGRSAKNEDVTKDK